MAIIIKTEQEIAIMRKAGQILTKIVKEIADHAKKGVSTFDLNRKAKDLCKKNKVKPAFFHYRAYPATACFGVNDTVVHGVPSKEEVLKEGDIISIDMGIAYKGYYSDKAITVGIGRISANAKKLINITKECLYAGIKAAKAGNTIGDIGSAIQSTAERARFSVVKQMVGHGIGKDLHEDPQIPGFGVGGQGEVLKPGMIFAIEAIINEGSEEIRFLDDGWTTKTVDGKLSALFEHCIVVREGKAEILTDGDICRTMEDMNGDTF